jgi:asparagine synthase (glutamine-hydrolysing)
MCGICGFNWPDPALARRMTDQLAHRGPDQEGVYADDHVSLGHRRLSIIDLSDHGRQPLSNEDGSIQVVFNGEIYNFAELRHDLEAKGHVFSGHSDTEVIVHGYEEYGVDVVHQFRGMFAFAVWDKPRQRLWVVRDRLGIKPLYYHFKQGAFIFASEIKAILEHPAAGRAVNDQAVYDYLGFEFVPAPETMFQDIYKLPAGHQLMLQIGQEPQISRYWDMPYVESDQQVTDERECVERIRQLLDDAVRYRLIADVPLAAFLSGGLDSSTIVAMMRRHISGRLRTFTIGYPDKTFSELDYAQRVAEQFETDHEVLMIEGMTPERIEKSLWHFDEPMTDLSSIPLMLICEQARQRVTVCLSGEGGDEVFAGYDRFRASRINRAYRKIPGLLRRRMIEPFVLGLADRPQKKGLANMAKRFVQGAVLPEEARHLRWQYFSSAAQDQRVFQLAFREAVEQDPFYRLRQVGRRYLGHDAVNREVFLDLRYEMPDSVLMKADRMSMACGLELRVPLLDHHLVEYMAAVPGDWKLRGLQTKHIFRKALEGILPKDIVYRGKQGYSLPVKNLLRGELRGYMEDLLSESPLIRRIVNPDAVRSLVAEHVSLRENHNHVLWGLLHVAIWHRRFFEQRSGLS